MALNGHPHHLPSTQQPAAAQYQPHTTGMNFDPQQGNNLSEIMAACQLSNEPPPMIFRSMSDASALRRNAAAAAPFPRAIFGGGNNAGRPASSWLQGYLPSGSSSSSDNNTTTSTTLPNYHQTPQQQQQQQLMSLLNQSGDANGFHSPPTTTTTNKPDEDDYDLDMVFDAIGALHNQGLNEPEDDNSTAPLQLSSPRLSLGGGGVPPLPSAPREPGPGGASSSIEVDGKLYRFDPELYDPVDVSLANEKYPLNAHYLRDFRCEQCPQFLQHKCNQHKPFTCFHWHFANQRRRRPLRKRDGTFNYSPDHYCPQYDETTGICPDGDECPLLHRTAGDTERRYHLRYYKTGMCVYDTDARGYCVKNGAHCAFAHGTHDLRMPVVDVRDLADELAAGADPSNGGFGGHHEKDRNAVQEDPRWQNTAFVLAFYKTELCKRPPRLCRQGYACPQYHNNKDRRRSPKKYKYRSTPCPSVKQGDEWGDPANCENQDDCGYCHTRTEQQFHPEIYKSTKCNDIQQSGHCPRGPFCAFAHAETSDEINTAREFATDPQPDLPGMLLAKSNTSPVDIVRANTYGGGGTRSMPVAVASSLPEHRELNLELSAAAAAQPSQPTAMVTSHNNLGPIARPRSFSTSTTGKPMSGASWLAHRSFKTGGFYSGSSMLHQQPEKAPQPAESFDELDGLKGGSNPPPTPGDNSLVSSILARGGSSLFGESEPINIPENRSATAAAAFNLSPPASNGQPNQYGTSLLEQLSSNQSYMPVFLEMQRLNEEGTAARNRIADIQDKMQHVMKLYQLQQLQKDKNRPAASADQTVNSRLNELDLILQLDPVQYQQQRVHDLSSLPPAQLIQMKQRLAQELTCIDEALKRCVQ